MKPCREVEQVLRKCRKSNVNVALHATSYAKFDLVAELVIGVGR